SRYRSRCARAAACAGARAPALAQAAQLRRGRVSVVSGRDAALRIVDPLAPRAGVKRGLVETRVSERENVVRGRDPRAAIADDVLAAGACEDRVEAAPQRVPRLE